MFFAIMLVCSPLNLIHHGNECFGIEDTNGYYSTKDKCNHRINEISFGETLKIEVVVHPSGGQNLVGLGLTPTPVRGS